MWEKYRFAALRSDLFYCFEFEYSNSWWNDEMLEKIGNDLEVSGKPVLFSLSCEPIQPLMVKSALAKLWYWWGATLYAYGFRLDFKRQPFE